MTNALLIPAVTSRSGPRLEPIGTPQDMDGPETTAEATPTAVLARSRSQSRRQYGSDRSIRRSGTYNLDMPAALLPVRPQGRLSRSWILLQRMQARSTAPHLQLQRTPGPTFPSRSCPHQLRRQLPWQHMARTRGWSRTDDGRPTQLPIRAHGLRRSRRGRREPENLPRPTVRINRGLAPHDPSQQAPADHGEIIIGGPRVTTMLPANRGAPVQATPLAAPPGIARSRLPRLKRTPSATPMMQADTTSGDPTPLLLPLRPLQLPHHTIHGWRARQAAQPPQPRQLLQARQLQPSLPPVQRPGTTTVWTTQSRRPSSSA